jgi:hypothetical protein
MNAMGLEYENRYEADTDNEYINFNTSGDEKILNVKGYGYTMSFSDYIYGNVESNVCSFDLDSVSFTVKYKSDKQQHLMLELNEEKLIEFKQDTFNFNQVMQRLIEDNGNDDKNFAPAKMELKASLKNIEVKLQINSLEIRKSKEGYKMESMSGNLFVRKLGDRLDTDY